MGALSVDSHELLAAHAGDHPARERLAERVLPTVLQWCARLGGPRVDAEDAAHDVLIVMITRLPVFEYPDRFGAWLFTVTRRVLARHRRRAWFRHWVPGADINHREDPGAGPLAAAQVHQTVVQVQAALESLSEPLRVILVLADAEDRTESEIGELLQLPLGTVRSRVRRAREAFLQVAPRHGLRPTRLEVVEGGS